MFDKIDYKKVGFAFFGFFVLAFFSIMIIEFTTIGDVANAGKLAGEYEGFKVTYKILLVNFLIPFFMSLVGLGISIYVLFSIFKSNTTLDSLMKFNSILVLTLGISIIGVVGNLMAEFPPEAIAGSAKGALALSVISLIACLAATFISSDTHGIIVRIVGGVGSFFISIAAILVLSQGTEGSLTALFTFLLLLGITTGVNYAFISENGINTKNPSSFNQTDSQEKISPAEKLKELKELLDSGAISEEEYDEKRKKYIEEL